MKNILAFAGSNSSTSINATLINYVVQQITTASVKTLTLTDYDIPMYSIDLETSNGIPVDIQLFKNEIKECDAVMISVNEHNGSVSAFFKNIMDWLSRADRNYMEGKKILLMSTSPGGGGAAGALAYAKSSFPRTGGTIVESFSFPSFQKNFDLKTHTVTDPTLEMGIQEILASFLQEIED